MGGCPAAKGCTRKAVREDSRSSAYSVLPAAARLVGRPSKHVGACGSVGYGWGGGKAEEAATSASRRWR